MAWASISKGIVAGTLLALTLVIAGCGGGGLSGTYVDSGNQLMIRFKGDQAYVTQEFSGLTTALKYSVKGDKVVIGSASGSGGIVLVLNKDGSLGGPMGMTLVKRSQ